MERHEEFKELLHPYLDGELSSGEQDRMISHLAQCQDCSREVKFFGRLKETVREKGQSPAIPEPLREKILAALRQEAKAEGREALPERPGVPGPAAHAPSAQTPRALRLLRPVLAVAAVILLVLFVSHFFQPPSDFYATTVLSHSLLAEGKVPLTFTSSNPEEVGRYLADHVAPDLQGMVPRVEQASFALEGVVISKSGKAPEVCLVFRNGSLLTLHMRKSKGEKLPGTPVRREGRTFHLLSMKPYNLVAWDAEGYMCTLVSTASHEQMMNLVMKKQAI